MSNLLQQAINCDDPDRAARIIQDAPGIESDDVVNYCFPTTWPADQSHLRAAQPQSFRRRSSGSLAMLAAMRRASSLVSRLLTERLTRSSPC